MAVIKVDDLLRRTVVYVNEYSADMEAGDAFAEEAKGDLLAYADAAARMVAQVAPASMQVAVTDANFSLTLEPRPDGRRHGMAALPPDYMRLIYISSSELYRPITALLPNTHPTYAMQFCPCAGVGSGAYAPLAYDVDGTVDVHSFDEDPPLTPPLYGGEEGTDETTVTMKYLVVPTVTGEGANAVYGTLKEELTDVVAMQAAALYLSMTDNEKAGQAQQMATGMLRGIVSEIER